MFRFYDGIFNEFTKAEHQDTPNHAAYIESSSL